MKSLNPNSLVFIRDFGKCKLGIDDKGQTWVYWPLKPEWERFKGQNISWLTCFWLHNFCGRFGKRFLSRIHLTCFRCKLRLIIAGKLPQCYRVKIHQVWFMEDDKAFIRALQRGSLSITEMLS